MKLITFKLGVDVQGQQEHRPLVCIVCIVCNFWSFSFWNNVFIFQQHSKKTKIQVYILPIS